MELESQFDPINPVPRIESLFDRPGMPVEIVSDEPTVHEAMVADVIADVAGISDTVVDDVVIGTGKAKHEATKAAHMVGGVISTFFKESWEQINEGENLGRKIGIGMAVGGIALMAVGGQLADRFRVPESANIPNAISVAKEHGNPAGAVALGLGVYAAQGAIGAAWGFGLKRFKKTSNVFNEAYPGYKATLAEENAGYLKTLWRHSVVGLGIGNTMFVAAEVLDNPEITNFGVLKTSNRSAKRVGAAATAVAFGVLTAAEANIDRYILWWSVPDVVDRLQKPTTWIAFGIGVEVLSRIGAQGVKGVKALLNRRPKLQEQE